MKSKLKKDWQYYGKKLALVFSCVLVTACGGDDFSDLDQKIAEIKARPKTQIDPLPESKTPEPFLFDPNVSEGVRDPFTVVIKEPEPSPEESTEPEIKPDFNRPKEDLESFALDTLAMVGTLKKDETLWALVKAANGTVYRVKEGNYLGLNYGKIIKVSNNEIKLDEIVPGKEPGKWLPQSAALKMASK